MGGWITAGIADDLLWILDDDNLAVGEIPEDLRNIVWRPFARLDVKDDMARMWLNSGSECAISKPDKWGVICFKFDGARIHRYRWLFAPGVRFTFVSNDAKSAYLIDEGGAVFYVKR